MAKRLLCSKEKLEQSAQHADATENPPRRLGNQWSFLGFHFPVDEELLELAWITLSPFLVNEPPAYTVPIIMTDSQPRETGAPACTSEKDMRRIARVEKASQAHDMPPWRNPVVHGSLMGGNAGFTDLGTCSMVLSDKYEDLDETWAHVRREALPSTTPNTAATDVLVWHEV
ncbi:Uu.00g140500.m01.CDS01 [Anthostomella pinea]|uniref:Uu.00g140500.m01.CDS01 n=1 Tax=Anthostomella pinea TaxID=933095 RepID=A0AAI8VQR6_9PEZI|nr:Uu.00g140500.m01.CDS01 [Anthostomella pinea]